MCVIRITFRPNFLNRYKDATVTEVTSASKSRCRSNSAPQETICLLLTVEVELGVLKGTTTVVDLDNVTVGGEDTGLAESDIFLTGVLGETPLQRLEDLLATSELELATTDGLDDMGLGGILGTDGEEDLANVDTGSNANGLTVRVTHTGGETIGSGARKHLVGTKDVEGMGTHADVVSVLTDHLAEVLVDTDTAGLEGLGGDLLLLVAHKVGNEGEEIDGGLLVSDIVNADLRVGHTTAVPRLDVRLVLLVTVATSGTATHDGNVFSLMSERI